MHVWLHVDLEDSSVLIVSLSFQDELNQVMTTNVWLRQVRHLKFQPDMYINTMHVGKYYQRL